MSVIWKQDVSNMDYTSCIRTTSQLAWPAQRDVGPTPAAGRRSNVDYGMSVLTFS